MKNISQKLALLGAAISYAQACSTDWTVGVNLCPGVICKLDSQCSTGVCTSDNVFDDGYCMLAGWMIALIVVGGLLVLSLCIIGCICCCRRRRTKLQKQLVVQNHYYDASGNPLIPNQPQTAQGYPGQQYNGQYQGQQYGQGNRLQ